MNSRGYKPKIKVNDTIILLDQDGLQPIKVVPGEATQSNKGLFLHIDMLGKEYGSKVWSHKAKTYKWALHPTPELWTLSLPHRTQILYTPDISLITTLLDLVPGSCVCESGTGSGSFSHAIARTIAPTGHLYTYDFHQERVLQANAEFAESRLSDLVTCQCRDVCEDGFGLENAVTAVFLDLPRPWEAIPHCTKVFKPGYNRMVSFSPCIEQVQKSCIALEESGFIEVQMHECLSQPLQVSKVTLSEPRLTEEPIKKESLIEEPINMGSPTEERAKKDNLSEEPVRKVNSTVEPVKKKGSELLLGVVPKVSATSHTGYLLSASYVKEKP